MECLINFNDGQRRNEVHDHFDMEQILGHQTNQSTLEKRLSTAHAGTRSDNMNSMCFAEVQVLKGLLEHGIRNLQNHCGC